MRASITAAACTHRHFLGFSSPMTLPTCSGPIRTLYADGIRDVFDSLLPHELVTQVKLTLDLVKSASRYANVSCFGKFLQGSRNNVPVTINPAFLFNDIV